MDVTNGVEVASSVAEEAEIPEGEGREPSPPDLLASEEGELAMEDALAPPPNQLKIDALRRLKALERRGKTVGTHLDELRALLTTLYEMLPDNEPANDPYKKN